MKAETLGNQECPGTPRSARVREGGKPGSGNCVPKSRGAWIDVHPCCSQPFLQTVRLKDEFRCVDTEKQQTELYLSEALRLRDDTDSTRLATLQEAQEVESLSREVACLIRLSFVEANERADLEEQ